MDIWGAPLLPHDISFGLQIPFALVQSEKWGRGGELQKFCELSGRCFMGAGAVSGTSHQWIAESLYFAPKWLLRRLGIMAPGNFKRAHRATALAVQLFLKTLLEPDAHSPGRFCENLAAIDRDLITIF